MTPQQVLPSFEASHAEWLRIGGLTFRKLHQFGPRPDFYRSQYWELVKQAFLTSKEFKCCRCSGNANLVHHLNYDCVGEDHLHPESLAAVCRSCHGLVEYARKAESLISRISRRISLCKGFLSDRYSEQNAVHGCARLLEYQDELANLRNLFASKIHYRNPRIKSESESEAVVDRFQQKRQAYEEKAASLVATWSGSEKEKAEQLLPMLELEIQNCRKFIAEVFEPVPPSSHSSGVEPKHALVSEKITSGVESLVVGIKFHRGHINGIAQGDGVELAREPSNAYDSNAVQVKLQTGETLGYLTREFAAALAKQMDAGVIVQSEVSRIVRDKIYVAVVVGKI